MISPYQLYDNECGRYTIRFDRIDGKLWVDISFSNKNKGITGVSCWKHAVKDGKIVPRQDHFFIPLGQDVQDYINRLIRFKAFL